MKWCLLAFCDVGSSIVKSNVDSSTLTNSPWNYVVFCVQPYAKGLLDNEIRMAGNFWESSHQWVFTYSYNKLLFIIPVVWTGKKYESGIKFQNI